jgi:hypothetical protein
MKLGIPVVTLVAGFLLTFSQSAVARPGSHPTKSPLGPCQDTAGAGAGDQSVIGHVNKTCNDGTEGDGGLQVGAGVRGPVVVIRVIDCGPPQVAGQLRPSAGNACGQMRNLCDAATTAHLPTGPNITTTATIGRIANGPWMMVGHDCAVSPTAARPQLTATMLLREVRELVPHPGIGIAPPGGTTLVNLQTLLWADTPADRSLGTHTLLGHHVALRVHVHRVDWTFGDGQHDSTTTPEPKYNPAEGCHTQTCPGYWGHTYTTTGPKTITATITWTGRYRVDTGPWQTIPNTVTGPTTTTTLTVKQARGILVPNPPDN